LAGGSLLGHTNLLGQSPMLKLTQLQSRTSAAAMPRHSSATLYDCLFSFNFSGLCLIKNPLSIQILAPVHEIYIGCRTLFSPKFTPLRHALPAATQNTPQMTP
jgi:hypothetical protein